MGPMGELGALFNPGMRHELEERQAKAARREEEGNAKDGDLRIDLESGVAVINAPDQDGSTGSSGSTTAGPATSYGDDSTPSSDDLATTGPAAGTEDGSDAAPAGRGVDRGAGGKRARGGKDSAAQSAGQPSDQPRPRGKRGVSAGR